MAKDGTARGGPRIGAGRKPDALSDKAVQGRSASVLSFPAASGLEGGDMPPVKEFLKESQKGGVELCAEDVFKSTWKWLEDRGCSRFVNTQLVEQYAMSVSRWVQCERMVSRYGFLGKHPTTGAAITSPYVTMSEQNLKQASQCWYQIWQVVRENCTTGYVGASPQDDLMERLLEARKG